MTQVDEREVLRLEAQHAVARRLVLRAIQDPDPRLVGRITDRGRYLLVEYRDAMSGYFWDLDALRAVLRHVRAGEKNVSVYEQDRPGENAE